MAGAVAAIIRSGNVGSANVAAALKWLTAEDSKSQRCRRNMQAETLERMLENPTHRWRNSSKLRKDLLKSSRDIPEPLSNRLDARIRLLRQQAVSGRRRMIAAVSAGSVLSVAVFAFFIWTNLRHSAATRIANSAEQMVTQGNLRQAKELLESNAWMSTTEQYLSVHGKLIEAEKKDETRAANFRAAIERAQSAASAQQADPAIAEADRLAITSDERRIVEDVKAA